ncbi:MAG: phospho-sugar mutase [Clostridia bacterium]|nr:phospho-sugar mutase [Clostridia bacterium]
MSIEELYELWKKKASADPDIIEELKAIEGNQEEISDRFYKSLAFGTGGLRGVIGAGTNRMNVYTVNQATQGLADYLNDRYDAPSVAIAYDSRIKSDVFAKGAAGVLAANGIKVYIYPTLVPTPMLSFAVRKLKCSSGIIITASHNPSKYNGYKCYDENGYQMTDEAAEKTLSYISKTDIFDSVKAIDFEQGIKDAKIEYIPAAVNEAFFADVLSQLNDKELCEKTDLSIIYTPLNGTGNIPVRTVLERAGFKNVRVVSSQEKPDGTFPTCPFPNPEIRQAFEQALNMAENEPADLLVATDPDCDRVGIAVFDDGEYKLLTGNETGVLLIRYLLEVKKETGRLPENPLAVKSFVTTGLVDAVAASFGVKVINTLTGFKYIGEIVTQLEKEGQAERFVIGMEESYGYLVGTHARDKDAVVSSLMICEMAAYYKARGKNLYRVMQDIYAEYGIYRNVLLNFSFEGASGMQKMSAMMDSLRENAPQSFGSLGVEYISDFRSSVETETATGKTSKIELPSSNVLEYRLEKGNRVIVRPSGTEPKIKIYITAIAPDEAAADALAEKIGADMKKYMGI